LVEKKIIIWLRVLLYNLMLNSGKKYSNFCKIIVHNGDDYTNKIYNMIYLDVNNKINIEKNKVK
jgi:hypothetical protein